MVIRRCMAALASDFSRMAVSSLSTVTLFSSRAFCMPSLWEPCSIGSAGGKFRRKLHLRTNMGHIHVHQFANALRKGFALVEALLNLNGDLKSAAFAEPLHACAVVLASCRTQHSNSSSVTVPLLSASSFFMMFLWCLSCCLEPGSSWNSFTVNIEVSERDSCSPRSGNRISSSHQHRWFLTHQHRTS